jgi:hypothetical protein
LDPVLALMEYRLEPTPEENQRHLSRTSESKWAYTFLQPFEDKSHRTYNMNVCSLQVMTTPDKEQRKDGKRIRR